MLFLGADVSDDQGIWVPAVLASFINDFTLSDIQYVAPYNLRRIPLNVPAISAKNIYQKTTHSTVTF